MEIQSWFRSVVLIRVAGIAIIVIAFASASMLVFQSKIFDKKSAEIAATADLATQSFQSNINLYTQTAYGARGLLSHSEKGITRMEFHHYVESLDIPRRMPGLSAILVIRAVSGAEKSSFLTAIHQDKTHDLIDASKFEIWPSAEKTQYLPITYAEPSNMSNVRAVLGFDYSSEPLRLTAFEQAVKNDEVIITQPVSSAVSKIQSLFLFLPYFKYGEPIVTPAERQKAALGAIVLGFRSEKLFNSAFDLFLEHNPTLIIQVFDGPAVDPAKLVYNSDEGKKVLGTTSTSERVTQVRTIQAVGRTWTFEFSDYANTVSDTGRIPHLVMIVFLVLISAMGGALLVKHPRHTTN